MAARTQANGNSRRLSAYQRRAAVERTWHQAPGAAAAVWHLHGSGADRQSAFSDRDAAHGRTRGEIHWARRRRARCAKVADGASELLQNIFGRDKNPSRLVYGVASLPLGTPVELELIFEVSN